MDKDIQSEINSLRTKGINFDEIFSMLVKIMKKVEFGIGLAKMNSNLKVGLKISSVGWNERLLGVHYTTWVQPTLCLGSLNDLVEKWPRSQQSKLNLLEKLSNEKN